MKIKYQIVAFVIYLIGVFTLINAAIWLTLGEGSFNFRYYPRLIKAVVELATDRTDFILQICGILVLLFLILVQFVIPYQLTKK